VGKKACVNLVRTPKKRRPVKTRHQLGAPCTQLTQEKENVSQSRLNTTLTATALSSHEIGSDQANAAEIEQRQGGLKRKRKTEKQLYCLQKELRGSNLLWSRQKIMDISERTGMSET